MKHSKKPHIINQIQSLSIVNKEKPDYSFQKVVSHSQLTQYKDCPKKWALQYVDGHKVFKENIHNIFGTAIHNSIQHYIDLMYNNSVKEADSFNIISFFKENLIENYNKAYKKNKNNHFSTPEELKEFYMDGECILNTFISKRGKYFSKRGWWLVGCEIPLKIAPNPREPNMLFTGALDIVLYHEPTNIFEIIDIKTSTRGWGDKEKKDPIKTSQIILYKEFFHQTFNIPLDKIEVKFFIVKRKIWEDSDFMIPRIQIFKPASGKIRISQSKNEVLSFIDDVFKDGKYQQKEYKPNPSSWNCRFCPFNDNKSLCKVGIPPE